FTSQIGNAAVKFLCELLLPTPEPVRPGLDGVFMDGLVVERADPAPAIIIDEKHRRFPPRALPKNAPLQNCRNHVVAVLEAVRFNNEIFGYDPVDRITAAIYQRSHVLNHNGWKRPGHARSINLRFTWSERTNPLVGTSSRDCPDGAARRP